MTGHLSPEQLVDLAEGAKGAASVPHLQSCGVCQERLAHLRATITEVTDVHIPEPSPLFWDHFSTRVREAVEAERTTKVSRWSWLAARPVWAGAVAVLVVAVAFLAQIDRSGRTALPPASPLTASVPGLNLDIGGADDASLSLVGDLAAELDWDGASEAGLTTHVGVDNDALSQLTAAERGELHELLKGELARRGA